MSESMHVWKISIFILFCFALLFLSLCPWNGFAWLLYRCELCPSHVLFCDQCPLSEAGLKSLPRLPPWGLAWERNGGRSEGGLLPLCSLVPNHSPFLYGCRTGRVRTPRCSCPWRPQNILSVSLLLPHHCLQQLYCINVCLLHFILNIPLNFTIFLTPLVLEMSPKWHILDF